jgi:DNA-binding transcriptional LysR family regulator
MHFKGFDLNLLVALDALLVEKNITRTGERIHLSQSATSGALARLREFFNDELLVQVGSKKMALTPLAEELAQPVREALLQAERILNRIPVFNPKTSTRNFRLMMSDYVAIVLMPRALPRIQDEAPGVTFELLSNAEHPVECLERGEVDLLIMPPQYISKLHPSEELFEDSYVCLAWSGNPDLGDTISLDEYKSVGHVGIRLGQLQMPAFDEWFLERFGFTRRIEVVTMTFDLVPRLVVGTRRLATVPERLARRYVEAFPLRVLPPPIEIPHLKEVAQWHKYRDSDSAIAWLRTLLCKVTEEATVLGLG